MKNRTQINQEPRKKTEIDKNRPEEVEFSGWQRKRVGSRSYYSRISSSKQSSMGRQLTDHILSPVRPPVKKKTLKDGTQIQLKSSQMSSTRTGIRSQINKSSRFLKQQRPQSSNISLKKSSPALDYQKRDRISSGKLVRRQQGLEEPLQTRNKIFFRNRVRSNSSSRPFIGRVQSGYTQSRVDKVDYFKMRMNSTNLLFEKSKNPQNSHQDNKNLLITQVNTQSTPKIFFKQQQLRVKQPKQFIKTHTLDHYVRSLKRSEGKIKQLKSPREMEIESSKLRNLGIEAMKSRATNRSERTIPQQSIRNVMLTKEAERPVKGAKINFKTMKFMKKHQLGQKFRNVNGSRHTRQRVYKEMKNNNEIVNPYVYDILNQAYIPEGSLFSDKNFILDL